MTDRRRWCEGNADKNNPSTDRMLLSRRPLHISIGEQCPGLDDVFGRMINAATVMSPSIRMDFGQHKGLAAAHLKRPASRGPDCFRVAATKMPCYLRPSNGGKALSYAMPPHALAHEGRVG